MKIDLNGVGIFIDVEGKQFVPEGASLREKPVCFLLHGGPGCDHTMYVPACSPLAEDMQLVYIDNRGHGRSDRVDPSTCTFEQNVEDTEMLRQALGLEQIVLLGQSCGGMIAQGYAAKYPEHLAGLILITTAGRGSFLEDAKEELLKRGTPEQIEMGRHLFEGTFRDDRHVREYFGLFSDLYTHTEFDKKASDEGWDRMTYTYEALNRGFRTYVRTFDYLADMQNVQVPTLIIGGREDWITPVAHTLLLAEHMPEAETVIMENSSHNVFYDENEKTIDTIRGFVRRRLL